MNWRETQAAFASALRDPVLDVPYAVGPRDHHAPLARFNVYRNNTAVSLSEAIADSYPVVHELVGDEFFAAMARAYVDQNVPASPVLIHYGGNFPAFIERFEPAAALPFLSDVARVEWAWVQAYHAADCASINAEVLQSIEPDMLDQACLELHPSLHLMQSDWPAISIWSAHQIDEPGARQATLGQLAPSGEYGFIVRPEFEVTVELVQPAVWQLLTTFRDGASLGAAAHTLEADDVVHFGGMLGYIFAAGAVTEVRLN